MAKAGSQSIQNLKVEMTQAAAVQGAIQENVRQIHSGVRI